MPEPPREAEPAEGQLVAQICAGDGEALEAFYRRYCDRLYSFIYWRVSGDEAAAEDLTQETFMAALRNLRSFQGGSGLFTWLCAIARHKVADHFRRRHRLETVQESLRAQAFLDAVTAESAEERLAARQRRDEVTETLRRLPARYQQALILKYLDGRSTREVAAALEVSTAAAESVISRARAAFRQQYAAVRERSE
ncbi:MAG TPA: RNA polymerase sigma factor [Dehalococcoidia bacterium]